MNIITKGQAPSLIEISDVSKSLSDDDFARFALTKMWSEIESSVRQLLIKTGDASFFKWHSDQDDKQFNLYQEQYIKLLRVLHRASYFESHMPDHVCDGEGLEIIAKLNEESIISEATIYDFNCGTGSRILSIMKCLLDHEGTNGLENMDIVLVNQNENSLQQALIQILYHLHINRVKVGKISAYVGDYEDELYLPIAKPSFLIFGTHKSNLSMQFANSDHDCVVAETEHLLVLAA